ncbi:MAG: hypothetical protein ACRELE_05430, partial [Gemmatimonadales bacterium]
VPVAATPAHSADSSQTAADTVSGPAQKPRRPDSTKKTTVTDTAVAPLLPSDTVSPTGRKPRLIWTPARQATWARMQREGHPLFRLLTNNCLAAVGGSPRYGDRGLWCAILYQITGNLTYAREAWNQFRPLVTAPPTSGNDVREELIENAVLFDWLYPALSPTERESAVAGLNGWANYAMGIGTPQYVGGIRLGDGDANVGYYFGLAAIDLATAGLSSQHVNWLTATQNAGSVVPVGGFDATGANAQTLRNKVAYYVQVNSAGGEWDESTEYNMGTQVLLAMGAEAVHTATGVDHYPEITAYLAQAARAQSYFVTPDLKQWLQWGDIEHPRGFQELLWKFDTWLGTVGGLTQSDANAGPYANGLLQAIFSKYGMTGYLSGEPWARFFLFYNPYAPTTYWQSGPVARYFPGSGNLYVRANNELFEARMSNRTGEDHEVHYLSDFQLYRNGEWVLTHPQGYGGTADHAEGVNSVTLAGLSAMSTRGPDGVQSGSDWWSITGSTSGMYYDMPYYDPPPAFVRRASRTIVYLQRGAYDIVVVQDSVDADDPKALPNLNRYRPADLATISGAAGLLQWVIHTPTMPTISNGTASWLTPGGQPVSVTTLSPGSANATVLQERTVLSAVNYQASELNGYSLRIVPAFTGGQIVLRHVIIVGASELPDIHLTGTTIHVGATTINIGTTVQVSN